MGTDMSLATMNNALDQNYTGSNLAIGGWDYCQPFVQTYYHYYPSFCSHYEPNKFEQAFKILNKLMEKKMLEVKTVKQFIETLGDIQSVL